MAQTTAVADLLHAQLRGRSLRHRPLRSSAVPGVHGLAGNVEEWNAFVGRLEMRRSGIFIERCRSRARPTKASSACRSGSGASVGYEDH